MLSTQIFPGSDEESFLRGNKYYVNNEYDNALQSYNLISEKGRAVLYNMGNCFYRKNDYAQALVYWSRAQIGASPAECVIINKNKEQIFKKIGINDLSFISRIERYIKEVVPYCFLFFLQLFFLMCCLLFIVLLSKRDNLYIKFFLICLFCLLVVITGILGIHYVSNGVTHAIIIKKDAFLFSGPDKGFHVLSPIAYAQEVVVKETRQGWNKIRYAGNIGWVEADVIQVI